MIKTRSDALLVWLVNTSAAGGSAVTITNSSNLFITNTNLSVVLQNSGGLFAQQSGAWAVSSTILNSAGWIVAVSNTGGAINILNSGGLFAQQSGAWTVTIANTGGTSLSPTIANTAGWVVTIANTGGTALSQTIANTAGWVVAQSNTGGNVNVANSAGWIVFNIDSRPTGTAVTLVVSTIGQVALLAANANRRAASIYNQSAQNLYMRLGSSVSATTYSLMIVSSGYYEIINPVYMGIITGLWDVANGQALITETT